MLLSYIHKDIRLEAKMIELEENNLKLSELIEKLKSVGDSL